jgi:hypothetical protein
MRDTGDAAAQTTQQNTFSRSALEEKWGRPVISAGFTVIPTVLLRSQQRLKLDPLDINLLMHLLSYWWQKDVLPHPGKNTLARAMNVDPKTVQRRIKALEKRGYIKRVARRTDELTSQTNLYDLSGLIGKLEPLAFEEHAQIKKRKARRGDSLAA